MKKFSFTYLSFLFIYLSSVTFVFAQDGMSKPKLPISIFIEGNFNRFMANNEQSNFYGGAGLVPAWTLLEYNSDRKSNIGIIFPVRLFQTNFEDELLETVKYGYSGSIQFRYNTLWNRKKEHTYFYMSLGPEVSKDIRKDNSGLLWSFQMDWGFKFNNPDLLFQHTEFGLYISLPFVKSAFKDNLGFSGFYFRYCFLDF